MRCTDMFHRLGDMGMLRWRVRMLLFSQLMDVITPAHIIAAEGGGEEELIPDTSIRYFQSVSGGHRSSSTENTANRSRWKRPSFSLKKKSKTKRCTTSAASNKAGRKVIFAVELLESVVFRQLPCCDFFSLMSPVRTCVIY